MRHRAQARGKTAGEGFWCARLLIDNRLQAFAGEQAHHRVFPFETPVHGQARPVRVRFVFGEAIGVFAGIAQGGPVDAAGNAAADIADEQLQGAADGGVGAVALAEGVDAGIHARPLRGWPVDDHHRRRKIRRAQQAVHAEAVVERRFHRGGHEWEVFGLAARHHRVDGEFFDGAGHPVRRNFADDLAGIAFAPRQHADDALGGRRHHRQPIGPAALEAGFKLVLGHGEFDSARPEGGMARGEPLSHSRLECARAAARAERRQPFAEVGYAGELAPLRPVPADDARIARIVFAAAQQGRHDFDFVAPGERKLPVVNRRDILWERRIVLHIHREPAVEPFGQHGNHRRDQRAGGAVLLDDERMACGQNPLPE